LIEVGFSPYLSFGIEWEFTPFYAIKKGDEKDEK
jgi:hypothetical protein